MFPITRWTLIQQFNDESKHDSRKALEELCQQYAEPVFAFVRQRIHSHEEAEDATQEFFARLIDGTLLKKANQQQGRFRTFLLHAVRDFLADLHDYKNAAKRGGKVQHVTLEPQTHVLVRNSTAEQAFEVQWIRATLQAALAELAAEYDATDRHELFETLKGALDDTKKVTAKDAAFKLRMTEAGVRVALHRMRKRLGQLIRQHILDTVEKPEDVDSEIKNLMQLLETNR